MDNTNITYLSDSDNEANVTMLSDDEPNVTILTDNDLGITTLEDDEYGVTLLSDDEEQNDTKENFIEYNNQQKQIKTNLSTEINLLRNNLNEILQEERERKAKLSINPNKIFIELCSAYRNRKDSSDPSHFIVQVSESGTSSNSTEAKNPLSNAYPIYNFQGPDQTLIGGINDASGNDTKYIIGSYPQPKFGGDNNTKNIFGIGNFSSPNLDGKSHSYNNEKIYSSTISNYYDGLQLCRYKDQSGIVLNSKFDPSGGLPNESSIIDSYDSFNKEKKNNSDISGNFQTSPNSLLQTIFTNGPNTTNLNSDFSIKDPSGWDTNNYWSINQNNLLNISNPQKITIHGGSDIDGFYNGNYLECCTLPLANIASKSGNVYDLSTKSNRFKKIVSYDGKTKQATISDENQKGFIAEDKNRYAIEDNNYINMNINGDWANTIGWIADTSGTSFVYKHIGSQDMSGSTGWIPQDRYRIRKDIPKVMGWGFNEDRDGARPRFGYHSNITGDLTGGSDWQTNGYKKEINFNEFSGTGPQNGANGCVSKISIKNGGKSFLRGSWVYTNKNYLTDNDNSVDNLYIEVLDVDDFGSILDARVIWPSSGYSVGDEILIYSDSTKENAAIIIVEEIGQRIDISNGLMGKTTGNLSTNYNEYVDDIIYIPSRGSESKSSQNNTNYNLTGYMNTTLPVSENKNPVYINDLPAKYNDDSTTYIEQETGTSSIKAYLTSTSKFIRRKNETNLVITESSNPYIWDYTTWNSIWSSGTYSEIIRTGVSSTTFKVTSNVPVNVPQICGFPVDLDSGTYTATINYQLLQGSISIFCRRWSDYNLISSDGMTPDIFSIGTHTLSSSETTKSIQFTIPKGHRNFERNGSYYVFGVVFINMQTENVTLTANINDAINLTSVKITKDDIVINNNQYRFGNPANWDLDTKTWSGNSGYTTIYNGYVSDAIQLSPSSTGSGTFITFLDKPNINSFTSTPNGNYGNGFDNQEIGEFGYKFTVNQDYLLVNRLGRELWNMNIEKSNTVNLWSVTYLDANSLNVIPATSDKYASSLINNKLSDDATQITISGTYFSSRGTLTINDEQINYTTKSGNILSGLTRGVNSTTAAEHESGSVITQNISSNLTQEVSLSETTSITVWSTDTYTDSGVVQINDELIAYASVSRTSPYTLNTLTRGQNGTTQRSHSNGSLVIQSTRKAVTDASLAISATDISVANTTGWLRNRATITASVGYNVTDSTDRIYINNQSDYNNFDDFGIILLNNETIRYYNKSTGIVGYQVSSTPVVTNIPYYLQTTAQYPLNTEGTQVTSDIPILSTTGLATTNSSVRIDNEEIYYESLGTYVHPSQPNLIDVCGNAAPFFYTNSNNRINMYIGREKNANNIGGGIVTYNNTGSLTARNMIYDNLAPKSTANILFNWGRDSLNNSALSSAQIGTKLTKFLHNTITEGTKDVMAIGWGKDSSYNNVSYDGKIAAFYKETSGTSWTTNEISEFDEAGLLTSVKPTLRYNTDTEWIDKLTYPTDSNTFKSTANTLDISNNIINEINNNNLLMTYVEYDNGTYKGKCKIAIEQTSQTELTWVDTNDFYSQSYDMEEYCWAYDSSNQKVILFYIETAHAGNTTVVGTSTYKGSTFSYGNFSGSLTAGSTSVGTGDRMYIADITDFSGNNVLGPTSKSSVVYLDNGTDPEVGFTFNDNMYYNYGGIDHYYLRTFNSYLQHTPLTGAPHIYPPNQNTIPYSFPIGSTMRAKKITKPIKYIIGSISGTTITWSSPQNCVDKNSVVLSNLTGDKHISCAYDTSWNTITLISNGKRPQSLITDNWLPSGGSNDERLNRVRFHMTRINDASLNTIYSTLVRHDGNTSDETVYYPAFTKLQYNTVMNRYVSVTGYFYVPDQYDYAWNLHLTRSDSKNASNEMIDAKVTMCYIIADSSGNPIFYNKDESNSNNNYGSGLPVTTMYTLQSNNTQTGINPLPPYDRNVNLVTYNEYKSSNDTNYLVCVLTYSTPDANHATPRTNQTVSDVRCKISSFRDTTTVGQVSSSGDLKLWSSVNIQGNYPSSVVDTSNIYVTCQYNNNQIALVPLRVRGSNFNSIDEYQPLVLSNETGNFIASAMKKNTTFLNNMVLTYFRDTDIVAENQTGKYKIFLNDVTDNNLNSLLSYKKEYVSTAISSIPMNKTYYILDYDTYSYGDPGRHYHHTLVPLDTIQPNSDLDTNLNTLQYKTLMIEDEEVLCLTDYKASAESTLAATIDGSGSDILVNNLDNFDSSGIVQIGNEFAYYLHRTGGGLYSTTTSNKGYLPHPSVLTTVLDETMSSTTTQIYLSGTQFATIYSGNDTARRFYIKIGTEIIRINYGGNVIAATDAYPYGRSWFRRDGAVTRGAYNTTAQTHSINSTVTLIPCLYFELLGSSSQKMRRGVNGTSPSNHVAGTVIKQVALKVIKRGINAVDDIGNELILSSPVTRTSTTIYFKTDVSGNADITGNHLPDASTSNPVSIYLNQDTSWSDYGQEVITYTGKTKNTLTGVKLHQLATPILRDIPAAGYFERTSTPTGLFQVFSAYKIYVDDPFMFRASISSPTRAHYMFLGAEVIHISMNHKYGDHRDERWNSFTDTSKNNLLTWDYTAGNAYYFQRNVNRLLTNGTGTILSRLNNGGAGADNVEIDISTAQNYSYTLPGTTQADLSGCFVQFGSDNFEYLELVSTTSSSITVKREPASTIAEDLSGTLSVIKLTAGTGKRRGLPSNTSSNYTTQLSTIKFIISGGSNGSGGSATTRELMGTIAPWGTDGAGDVDNIRSVTDLNGGSVNLGTDTFSVANTVISFCRQINYATSQYINTMVDHPAGTKLRGLPFWTNGRYADIPIANVKLTTAVYHPKNTQITTYNQSYIDVSGEAVPAFLNTNTTVDIGYKQYSTNSVTNNSLISPKVNLYVGCDIGTIRKYEFGVFSELHENIYSRFNPSGLTFLLPKSYTIDASGTYQRQFGGFLNDWVDRGDIKDVCGNTIDVGSRSAPAFVDISGNGTMHMFVGNSTGTLTYYRNTGTNLTPVWQEGLAVRDTSNNIIKASSNSKPAFANMRGVDPIKYDLFIGDGSGTIVYYHHNGSQGPWDGSTTTWPFALNNTDYPEIRDKLAPAGRYNYPTLSNTTRGYNSTTISTHNINSTVSQWTGYYLDTNPYVLETTKLLTSISSTSTDDIPIESNANFENSSYVIIGNEHISFNNYGTYIDPNTSVVIDVCGNAAPIFYKDSNNKYQLFIGRSLSATDASNGSVLKYNNTGTVTARNLVEDNFAPNSTTTVGWGNQGTLFNSVISLGDMPLSGSYLGSSITKSLKNVALIGWGRDSSYNLVEYDGKISTYYKETTGVNTWSTNILSPNNPNITGLLRYKEDVVTQLHGYMAMYDSPLYPEGLTDNNTLDGYASNFAKMSTDILNQYDQDLNSSETRFATIDNEEIKYKPMSNDAYNQSSLNNTITSLEPTEIVTDTSKFIKTGGIIKIDNEYIQYTSLATDASGSVSTTLAQPVSSTGNLDIFLADVDLLSHYTKYDSDYGIVQIGDELIRFSDYNILIDYISEINMERGYLGTTATTHAQGATVTLRTYIKKNGMTRGYASSTPTPHLKNTLVKGNYSSIDPTFRGLSRLSRALGGAGTTGEIFIENPNLFDSSGVIQIEDELIMYNLKTPGFGGDQTGITTLRQSMGTTSTWNAIIGIRSSDPLANYTTWSTETTTSGQWRKTNSIYTTTKSNAIGNVYGIVKIGDELIKFTDWLFDLNNLNQSWFGNTTRGYLSTTATSHSNGATVQFMGFILPEYSVRISSSAYFVPTRTVRGAFGTEKVAHAINTQVKQINNFHVSRGSNATDLSGNKLYSANIVSEDDLSINLRAYNYNNSEIGGLRLPDASPSNPVTIRIGNEYISYTSKTNNRISGLTRNLNVGTLGKAFTVKSIMSMGVGFCSWQPITLSSVEQRHKFRSDHHPSIYEYAATNQTSHVVGFDYVFVGAEKVQYQSYLNGIQPFWSNPDAGTSVYVTTDISDNQLGCVTSYPGPWGTERLIAWSTNRNINRRKINLTNGTQILAVDASGGDGITTVTIATTDSSSISGSTTTNSLYNQFPKDISGCYVSIQYEYLKLVSYTNTSVTLLREPASQLATGESYTGTLTSIKLAAGTGKRRVWNISEGSGDNALDLRDGSGVKINFIMSGGSDNSSGYLLRGTIIPSSDNVDTITSVTNRSDNSQSVGSSVFNTSNTVISFCNAVTQDTTNISGYYVNTAVDHPIGTKVQPMNNWNMRFATADSYGNVDKTYLTEITTNIYHPPSSDVSGNKYSYIDVSGEAVPALLDTGTQITLNNTETNKYHLYVGNDTGNIRYYEFGTINNSSSTFLNDWVDRGNIKDSGNTLIDVGQNSAPTFVDISGNGILHMFVGNKAGQLTYFQNTGTNLIPIWSPGVIVRDSSNNTIDVSGNAKPNFANIRGLDPARYDLFIGDASGTIVFYENNGLGGPWSGAAAWPFIENSSIYRYLTNKTHQTKELIYPTLQNIVRGSNSTTAASHSVNSTVSQRTQYKIDNTNNSGRAYNSTISASHSIGNLMTLISGKGSYFDISNNNITITGGSNAENITYSSIDYSNNAITGTTTRENVYPSGSIVSQLVIPVIDNSGNRNVTDVSGTIIASAVINSSSYKDIKIQSSWATSALSSAITTSSTSITVDDAANFWSGSRTYSALIGTYSTNYEIINYTGISGNQLQNVTRGKAGTTAKEWSSATSIIQCSGWGWTTLSNTVTLNRNSSYYITLSSNAADTDPWRFGSWNQIGSQWPTPPPYSHIPDYINGSSSSDVNTSTFGTYNARVFSRRRASGSGYQNIKALPDENTDNTNKTGWPIVNVSYREQEESEQSSYNIDVTLTDTSNNTNITKSLTLNTYAASFITLGKIEDISSVYSSDPTQTTRHYNGYNRLVTYRDDVLQVVNDVTITVTVADVGGNNKFVFNGDQTTTPILIAGTKYIFDQSNSTNNGHPLRFSLSNSNQVTYNSDASGTPGTTGATVTFTPSNVLNVYAYCTVHGYGMGSLYNTISISSIDLQPSEKMIMSRGWRTNSDTLKGNNMAVEFSPYFNYSENEKSSHGYGIIGLSLNNNVISQAGVDFGFGFGNYGGSLDDGKTINYTSAYDLSKNVITKMSSAFDNTNNKVILSYDRNNMGYSRVGTVSGTNVIYSDEVAYCQSVISNVNTLYNPASNKLVNFFTTNNINYFVTGRIISNELVYDQSGIVNSTISSYNSNIYPVLDTINNKVVIFYHNIQNYLCYKIGTIANNSMSFTSEVVINTYSASTLSTHFDANSNQIMLLYPDTNNNNYCTLKVCTILSNTLTFNSTKVVHYNYTQNISSTYINNGKSVVIVDDKDNKYLAGIVLTNTGSSITVSDKYSYFTGTTWTSTIENSLYCIYNSARDRIIVAYRNHNNNQLHVNTANIYNTDNIIWHKGHEFISLATINGYFSYVLDQNNKSIIVYNENNVSKYRTGTDYTEIYTGMKIYEAGSVVYTLPNNGYYENGVRYKVKYDESSEKIRYYVDDVQIRESNTTSNRFFYFKYAHSRLGSGDTSGSQVPRTRDCITGVNASLKSTTLDLKLSKYSLFKDDVFVATIIPSTFYDMTIDATYAVSGTNADSFYIVRNGLYLKESPDYYTTTSYSVTITETNLYGGTFSKAFTLSVLDPTSYTENKLVDFELHQDYLSDISGNIIPIYPTVNIPSNFEVSISGTDSNSFNVITDRIMKSYDTSGVTSVGTFTYQSGIKMITDSAQTDTSLRKGVTGYFYSMPSQSFLITINAQTNAACVNGAYLYVSEKSLDNDTETVLISKASDNPLYNISSKITSTREEFRYFFKTSGTGLLKIAVYFQAPWNQNDHCIINSINILQEDILGSWKLTNRDCLQPYVVNYDGNNVIGDACAENGLAVIIINNEFNPVVSGNKYDGSLSRYTRDGSFNNVNTGEYNIKNSYNWEIITSDKDGAQPLIYTANTNNNVLIKLRSLTIPITSLRSSVGGNISSYPFIYVSLVNTSSTGGSANIISSNNPNTLDALFKVSIENINITQDTTFITLDGDDQVQSILLDSSSDLEVRVYFGDGTPLKILESDNIPPVDPNLNLQITALFELQEQIE